MIKVVMKFGDRSQLFTGEAFIVEPDGSITVIDASERIAATVAAGMWESVEYYQGVKSRDGVVIPK